MGGPSRSSSAMRSWPYGVRPWPAKTMPSARSARLSSWSKDVPTLAPQLQARAGVLTGEAAVTLGARTRVVAGDLVNTAHASRELPSPAPFWSASRRCGRPSARSYSKRSASTRSRASWRRCRPGARSGWSPQRGGEQRTDALEPPSWAGTRSSGCSRNSCMRPAATNAPASCRSPARPASARAGLSGSSRSTWTAHRGRVLAPWSLAVVWRGHHVLGARRDGPAPRRLTEDDDEATTRERIHATVAEYVPDPEERAAIQPALLTLLGSVSPPGDATRCFRRGAPSSSASASSALLR